MEIQNNQGVAMPVSDFIVEMAKAYGWTSGKADESLALVMEEIRNDPENSIGAGQSLNGCIESAYIIEFCRGREWISGESAFDAWDKDLSPYHGTLKIKIVDGETSAVIASVGINDSELFCHDLSGVIESIKSVVSKYRDRQ